MSHIKMHLIEVRYEVKLSDLSQAIVQRYSVLIARSKTTLYHFGSFCKAT